jgi:hypothetical protein
MFCTQPARGYLTCDWCNAPLCIDCTENPDKVHDCGDDGDYCSICQPDKSSFEFAGKALRNDTLHLEECPDSEISRLKLKLFNPIYWRKDGLLQISTGTAQVLTARAIEYLGKNGFGFALDGHCQNNALIWKS